MDSRDSWQPRVLLIGALAGALTGLAGAYLLIRRAEAKGTKPDLDAGEGLRIGLVVMGLLRQIALLGDSKESS